jgi:hypothetical protein
VETVNILTTTWGPMEKPLLTAPQCFKIRGSGEHTTLANNPIGQDALQTPLGEQSPNSVTPCGNKVGSQANPARAREHTQHKLAGNMVVMLRSNGYTEISLT